MGIQIGVLTRDGNLSKKIIDILKNIYKKHREDIEKITVINLKTPEQAFDFINFEFPEYLIIDFSDSMNNKDVILKTLNLDPWLHFTGILVILNRQDMENIPEAFNKLNVLSFINANDMNYQMEKILKIILINKQVAVQKNVSQKILDKRTGSFILDNDISMISSYVNIITSTLVNEKYIAKNKSDALQIALTELITNGIEHGNCEISNDEKAGYLENLGNINDLIAIKNRNEKISRRKIILEYSFSNEKLVFTIRDQGNGFDHKNYTSKKMAKDMSEKVNGRGINLSLNCVDELSYNEKGNEVTIFIKTDRDKKTVPEGFLMQKELSFRPGEIVFREGERSNCLYYIVQGTYEVVVKSKVLAELTPSDIFLGEMSFLLNNKRVATIVSKTQGKLIEIQKKSFIEILKKYPNYGLFISKLLARRLEITNNKKVE
jgi:anti-sigma regulatory factor (Ser/Thr protein kinase)